MDAGNLRRWRDRDWLRADGGEGSGSRAIWRPWVRRVVPMLQTEGRRGGNNDATHTRDAMMRAVAHALEAAPDAPWLVDLGDRMHPVATTGDAVRAALILQTLGQCPCVTLVSPPP